MAIKEILLHLDNSPSCGSRIDFAIAMALTHDAHIKGLYVVTHTYYASSHGKGEADQINAVRDMFRMKTELAGVQSDWFYVDWSVVGVSISEVIHLYAYYADLVIIGQPNQESQNAGTPFDLPERLGLGTGRPILLVPYAGNFTAAIDRVMIAWKSGRESSRVVLDALPILMNARHVSVVTVLLQGQPVDAAATDAQALCDYLARHGIMATHEEISTRATFPVGDVLLNHACEQNMDLLAMGAFAPTRRGAFAMGSIARHLMNHMTVPVLISH